MVVGSYWLALRRGLEHHITARLQIFHHAERDAAHTKVAKDILRLTFSC